MAKLPLCTPPPKPFLSVPILALDYSEANSRHLISVYFGIYTKDSIISPF